jgi:hypothetical protein
MKEDIEYNSTHHGAPKEAENLQIDEVIVPETDQSHQLGISEVQSSPLRCGHRFSDTNHYYRDTSNFL